MSSRRDGWLRVNGAGFGEEKLIESRNGGADTGDGHKTAELVAAVDVGGALAEPDWEEVKAEFDRVATSGPGEVVDDLEAALARDTGTVAVQGAEACDVDVGRKFVNDAVGDASLAIEEAEFIDEARVKKGYVLDGEAIRVFVEAAQSLQANETIAEGGFAIEVVIEASGKAIFLVDLGVDAGRYSMGSEGLDDCAGAGGRNTEGGGILWSDGEYAGEVLLPALITAKVKDLVFLDRPGNGAAVVVAVEDGLGSAGGEKKRGGAEDLLTGEEKAGAVDGVTARAGEGVLDAAGDAAEFGGKVRYGLEFGNGFLADDDIARAALELVGDAIDVRLAKPVPP